MQTLIETYQRLLAEIRPSYRRRFYDEFVLDSRLTGIVGARGVGKTTFLINYLREHYAGSEQALYLSADNLYFVEHTLLETADRFVKEFDGKLLCIDEIHRYKNWNQELKNIYDSYPGLTVIFSGSSSLDLIKGRYDLSRRANLKTMYGFSFREFLEIKKAVKYPALTLKEIYINHQEHTQKLMKTPKLLGYLKEYFKTGYYPTFLELSGEQAYQSSLRGIIDKIIFEDISSLYSLRTSNLVALKKIIYFFATAQPGSVNINRLANSLKKDHTTIAEYVQILKDTGLLRFLLKNKQGHALVRNAEKIYLDNSNLLYVLNTEVGKEPLIGVVRELFVINNLQNAGYPVFYSATGDIECVGEVLEIGKDDILIGGPKTIPLYLFGFLS